MPWGDTGGVVEIWGDSDGDGIGTGPAIPNSGGSESTGGVIGSSTSTFRGNGADYSMWLIMQNMIGVLGQCVGEWLPDYTVGEY